ncbi:MAG: SufE family protein [Lachnospiraceae bacterium]|nr:SufE family protein [Lachnospiraceae bacterium]
MSYIDDKKADLKEEFSEFEDGFEKYAYLVEIAGLLPAYPEDKRTEEHLVKGCQSHVWLNIYEDNGKFHFDADSDTLIIKGVMLLLQDVLCEAPVEEVAKLDLDILEEAGIKSEFSDTRQKGIGAAIKLLQDSAVKMLTK